MHMVQLMHCQPIISCSSKIQNGLPLWCRLTQVVVKRPLNGCGSISSSNIAPAVQVGPAKPAGHWQRKLVHSSTQSAPFAHGRSAHGPAAAPRGAHESRLRFADVITPVTSSDTSSARPPSVTSRRQPTNPDVLTSPACDSRVDMSLTPATHTSRHRASNNLQRMRNTCPSRAVPLVIRHCTNTIVYFRCSITYCSN